MDHAAQWKVRIGRCPDQRGDAFAIDRRLVGGSRFRSVGDEACVAAELKAPNEARSQPASIAQDQPSTMRERLDRLASLLRPPAQLVKETRRDGAQPPYDLRAGASYLEAQKLRDQRAIMTEDRDIGHDGIGALLRQIVEANMTPQLAAGGRVQPKGLDADRQIRRAATLTLTGQQRRGMDLEAAIEERRMKIKAGRGRQGR
jgi:hypothetical protein